MALKSYRLEPPQETGFHFGREGYELETSAESFSSDALFSAMIVSYVEIIGDVESFLAPWLDNDPPFIISSVFPYVGNISLLPVPRLPVHLTDLEPGIRKRLKRLRYVSSHILRRLLAEEPMDDSWTVHGPQFGLQGGSIWLDEADILDLPETWRNWSPESLQEAIVWDVDTVPRVTVDRRTNVSNIYQMGRTVFAQGCGLWFLADIRRDEETLDTLVDELSLRGIGGERNAGYGAFQVGAPLPQPNLPTGQKGARVMTLSRYHPREEEIAQGVLGEASSYDLVNVSGWLTTPGGAPQRRKQVRMIEAGSILDNQARQPITGQLVDVRPEYSQTGAPDHPVYRNGFAFLVNA